MIRSRGTTFGVRYRLSLIFVATLLSGCQGGSIPVYPVTGQVTVGGVPATGAVIIFHPQDGTEAVKKLRPYGTVDSAGRFTLNCLAQADGAPAGTYKVTIAWEVADPAAVAAATGEATVSDDPEAAVPVSDRLGGKYSDVNTTILTATIKSGSNQLPPFAL